MPNNHLSLATLREGVHQALKGWGMANDKPSPLSNLLLYQQTERQIENSNAATMALLQQAFQKLQIAYQQEADLLRMRFIEGKPMHQVAPKFHWSEPWGNKKQRQAIDNLTTILEDMERQARDEHLARLERRLNLPPPTRLIGVAEIWQQLLATLTSTDPAVWLIALKGLGGIGKTALANEIVRQVALTNRFYDIAWVSAKQQNFLPGLGLQQAHQPALDINTLTDNLLEQLGDQEARTAPPQYRFTRLAQLLKTNPYLIVIDNLETMVDYQRLLPELRRLANPTLFLLTSRQIEPYADVAQFNLHELSREDSSTLLRHEAEIRHLPALLDASPDQLTTIYEVVGGNPLALKLVVGQLQTLPLAHVLQSLQQAQGKKVDELYTFIYWQAWRMLADASQQALLVMPVTQNGTFDQLLTVSQLETADLYTALEQLTSLSLLEVSGGIEERRYHIHRLTETFLLTEIAKWQSRLLNLENLQS